MSGPVAEYDMVVAELRGKAANAARRNKPTMWAYYLDAAVGLEDWFFDVKRTDGAYAGAALALTDHAAVACPNLSNPIDASRLWARGIYARRILRAWGVGAPRVSLTWLHDRADQAA